MQNIGIQIQKIEIIQLLNLKLNLICFFLFLLRELNNETEESSVNDESGEANEETIAKPSAVLKRRRTKSIMPSTKSKAVPLAQSESKKFFCKKSIFKYKIPYFQIFA